MILLLFLFIGCFTNKNSQINQENSEQKFVRVKILEVKPFTANVTKDNLSDYLILEQIEDYNFKWYSGDGETSGLQEVDSLPFDNILIPFKELIITYFNGKNYINGIVFVLNDSLDAKKFFNSEQPNSIISNSNGVLVYTYYNPNVIYVLWRHDNKLIRFSLNKKLFDSEGFSNPVIQKYINKFPPNQDN
ncbi:MAG: hypothetical protein QXD98_01765 [Candidatus Diapherotrites archaeon]